LAVPASASAVSTLTGETLVGSNPSGGSAGCPSPTFSVSGTATGPPYAGTFSEGGGWTVNSFPAPDTFAATFTITSGSTTITGSKAGPNQPGDRAGCGQSTFGNSFSSIPYTATIQTPNGNFHDEGLSDVSVFLGAPRPCNPCNRASLVETFTSSLSAPILLPPTNKDQCKNNGWKNYPQFKNQGQCVSFVESHSQT